MDPDSSVSVAESFRNFGKARMSAFWQEVWGFLTGRSIDLLRFEEVKSRLRLRDERYIGLQEIDLDKIVGSVGRYKDFTRSFLPLFAAHQRHPFTLAAAGRNGAWAVRLPADRCVQGGQCVFRD